MKKVLLALLGLVLLVFSCGNKSETKVNNELKELTIVLDWVPNTNHTGLFVAKDKGYFEEEGIKVNIVQPSEDSSSAIVGSGRAEFGIYFQPNMVKRLLKGTPITAVAAILQHNTAGLMSLKSDSIKEPKDLNGKRYSSWEDKIDDATVKHLVGNDLNIVPGEATDATAALKTDIFDYIIAYYAWDGIHAGLKGVDINFFFFKDYEPKFDYYSPVIIANNDFLKENPELAKKALKAIKKGYEFSSNNPEEAADILIKNAPEGDAELMRESQKWISSQYIADAKSWGVFDIDRWDSFYTWLYEEGLLEEKLPSSAGVTNEYISE